MRRSSFSSGVCVACAALAGCALYEGGRAGAHADASTDASMEEDVSTADAMTDVRLDTAEAGDPCDKDKDGYVDRFCGGIDCCDTDAIVHPGVTDWFDTKNKCGRWDYNCDDLSEQEIHAGTDCAGCQDKYFEQPTGCGSTGSLVTCSSNIPFGCNKPKASSIQRCR